MISLTLRQINLLHAYANSAENDENSEEFKIFEDGSNVDVSQEQHPEDAPLWLEK